MILYDDPENPQFAALEQRHAWFPRVLEIEYGEADAPEPVPTALDWLSQIDEKLRYDFADIECSLAMVDGAYACTVWDVSGEDDYPWAVFVVDDFGARLLPEYSVLTDEPDDDDDALEAALARATAEVPTRRFARTGSPVAIPAWLKGED